MTRHPSAARDVWRRLEIIHAVTYFAPESQAALTAAGYRGFRMSYFAARAAPLGAVGPQVVQALFYNFAADRVARALPEAWDLAAPDMALSARLDGAVVALGRILGDDATGPAVAAAAELAGRAAKSAPVEGRTLFAANTALEWPATPLAALWHAATLLREHRGDGHVAVLTTLGVGGRESNVLQSLAGNVDRAMIQRARDYDDDEWSSVVTGLVERGLVEPGGTLTASGLAFRREIEDRTDAAALGAYAPLDDADLAHLVTLLDPIAQAVVATGEIPAQTPMGPTLGA